MAYRESNRPLALRAARKIWQSCLTIVRQQVGRTQREPRRPEHVQSYTVGDACVEVALPDDPTVVDTVSCALHHLPPGTPRPTRHRISISPTDDGTYDLRSTTDGSLRAIRLDDLGGAITDEMMRIYLETDHRPLHLHAAAVVDAEHRGILLAGPSGSGKTALALSLAHRGLGWVSDEIVAVDADGRISGFPRLPMVKAPDVRRLRRVLDGVDAPPMDKWYPDLRALGFRIDEEGGASLLVIPHWSPGGTGAHVPVDPLVAIERLLVNSFDIAVAPSAAVPALVRMVAGSVCLEVDYEDSVATARDLDEVLQAATHSAPHALTTSENLVPGLDVTIIQVHDGARSLLYHPVSRSILRLAGPAAAAWREHVEAGAENPFEPSLREALASLGFLPKLQHGTDDRDAP